MKQAKTQTVSFCHWSLFLHPVNQKSTLTATVGQGNCSLRYPFASLRESSGKLMVLRQDYLLVSSIAKRSKKIKKIEKNRYVVFIFSFLALFRS
jgi:hypothetical protein